MSNPSKIVPALSFNFLTPLYDIFSSLGGFGKSFKLKVLQFAQIKDGESIVDVGCGTGTLAILLKQKYPHSAVVGIDPDETILQIARRKTQKEKVEIKFVKAWAQEIPISSNSIDVVISSLIFHHLPTEIKKEAIKEIYRILKKDGKFILADFGKPESVFFKIFSFFVQLLQLPEAKTMKDNIEGKLPHFLKEAGFKVEEIEGRYQGVQFLLSSKR